MPHNPIIFLDFDGVLNNQLYFIRVREEKKYDPGELDNRCVKLLNDLCKETGAKVVITSTWRLGRSIEELEAILKKSGFTGEILGKTEDLRIGEAGDCVLRGNEILHWIKNHESEVGGIDYWQYKNYVIFDDDSDMLLWQKDNYIYVDPYCGLTPHSMFLAKKILRKPDPLPFG